MQPNHRRRIFSSFGGQTIWRSSFVLFLLIFMLGSIGRAQTITATISGTVKDATGAVVPGATVEIKNTGTGVTRTTRADARGAYHASQLSLGSYQVQASNPGFKTQIRTGITLTVGQEASVDLVMEVGQVTESITVMGEAPLVETTGSATLGGLVTN